MRCVSASAVNAGPPCEPNDDLRTYWLTNFLPPYGDVHLERIRANQKHASSGRSAEQLAPRDGAWLPILTEELGEVARAICDREPLHELRSELVQVAAMACAWISAIDRAEGSV